MEDSREGEADRHAGDVDADDECVLETQVAGKSRPEGVEVDGEGEEEESAEEVAPDISWMGRKGKVSG